MFDIAAALSALYEEVSYTDFYRDIFPVGSFEQRGVYEDGKYNGIAVAIEQGGKRTKRLTVTDDLEAIDDMAASDDFCLQARAEDLPMRVSCMLWRLIWMVWKR